MMPIYNFLCPDCKALHETLAGRTVRTIQCPNCGGKAKRQVSAPGGYQMSSGGSSTRPKHAGCFKKGKGK